MFTSCKKGPGGMTFNQVEFGSMMPPNKVIESQDVNITNFIIEYG
ncbi:MAG: hypothetical protein WA364_25790 [Candidatus Nitrosopolaris sp.]